MNDRHVWEYDGSYVSASATWHPDMFNVGCEIALFDDCTFARLSLGLLSLWVMISSPDPENAEAYEMDGGL